MLTIDGMRAEVRVDEFMLAVGSRSRGDEHHVSLTGTVTAFAPDIPGLPLDLPSGEEARITVAVNCGPRLSREAETHPGALGRLVVRRNVDVAGAADGSLHFTLVVFVGAAYLDRLLMLRHDVLRIEPAFRRDAAPRHESDGWHLVVDEICLTVTGTTAGMGSSRSA